MGDSGWGWAARMTIVLIYSVVLLLAVLLSDLARRSVLSTAVIFLVAGFAASAAGWIPLSPDHPAVAVFSELALVSVLFTDGMNSGVDDIARAWRLPGRALLLGMPLVCAGTAVLAHALAELSWGQAFLLGAVLSPTDPVFAAALVGNQQIPQRLRRLLNVESGLNDGLALPVVLFLLHALGSGDAEPLVVLGQVGLGIAIGAAVPLVAIGLECTPLFSTTPLYQPLFAVAIVLLVWAITSLTHANTFLAAFAAGVTVATVSQPLRNRFRDFGETATELIKLAALLVFGSLISVNLLGRISWTELLFCIAAIVLVRPAAILIALLHSDLPWRERVVAGWFGPKGFASVVFGLFVLRSSVDRAEHLFHLIAVVVALSIVAHSSTDVLAARWLKRTEPTPPHPAPPHGTPVAAKLGEV
jgi:NhaP-type Na+/H+ or K+/H+ antiporter